jgi:hypothetical protein
MYLFRIFRSFLPLHNPIGFGASDFVVLAVAVLLAGFLLGSAYATPFLRQLSQKPRVCASLLLGLAIGLRLALLPQSGVPIPSGADDFSYLLLGDTLAHFRLANAAHPMHQFFEAVFVLQEPKYASIYPLGQGLFLALGELVLRNAWAGVLLSCGGFCALCYWMLRGWVAPVWALLGGLLAVVEFGPLTPWVNSYWGGFVSAMAGCLVFGALPRLRERPKIQYAVLLGVGLGLQFLTRPFEAVFLAVAASFYLWHGRVNWKVLAVAAGVFLCALELTAAHNKAVTQSWLTMPYMESRSQYGVPATLTFQQNATPHRAMTAEQELDYRAQAAIHGPGTDSWREFVDRLGYRFRYLRFFLLPPLYFALIAFLPSLREWRYAWLAGTVALFALGTNVYAYFYPQYVAALTCVFVLIGVKGLQASRGAPRNYVAAVCAAGFLFWFGIYASGDRDLLALADFQSWYYINRGDPQGRLAVEKKLAETPGQQLVFVRYSPAHRFEEWIHNDADIDAARTVWANDLGAVENEKLIHYYPQRKAWLLEPDARPVQLAPYAAAQTEPVGSPFETVH